MLLNEADSLAKVMPSDIPLKQRRWLGLQMLEGDIYSRAYAGEASQHLDAALTRLRNEMDDPALHIADARYQCIAAICDVVSNTLTAEPSRFTTAVDKIVLNRFLGLPIFLFVMYLMFLLAINIGGALQPLFDVGSVALFVHGIQWIGYTLHFPDWLTIFLAQAWVAVLTPFCHWCLNRHDVPVPLLPRGLRLYGACGVCDGPSDAGAGLAREILCTADRWFRL